MANNIELTIVMPCLNEAETLERCIIKAKKGIEAAGVRGEILIADNGSADGSIEIAHRLGVRVEHVKAKGYGNALRYGILAAAGKWIIMGDSDDSYDFSNIKGFIEKLRTGDELVMGCRLPNGGGTISPGAMPWKNRWIGNPSLSFLGRLFFKTPIHDFHCGMRGFSAEGYRKMDLQTTGMEFASEMVMKATIKGLRVSEVPITLYKDGRSRPPHLKPWRDGWRHLRFMLIYSPKWLFLYPGVALFLVGVFGMLLTGFKQVTIGNAHLDVGVLAVACMCVVLGIQFASLGVFTKVFAVSEGLLNADHDFTAAYRRFSVEKGVVAGVLAVLLGLGLLVASVLVWKGAGFGPLDYGANMRRLLPATTLVIMGLQIISSSFFLGVLGLKTVARPQTLEPAKPKQ
ncbi:MAG TPA: glycosyltransferase family 2 protein [Candidatus Limnocylindria bacterium]|nr:glycosyltransferase family 2 protein [Candidatus Limnocylindria bacterium]